MITIDYTNQKDTRSGFGAGILEAGRQNPEVVTLCADLVGSLKLDAFIKEFPERFFQCGIAEANMMGISAGLATAGKIPFACTFANFATGRVFDQVRQSIAYAHKNVKIAASHAGLTLGEDGATHQICEDIGLMQMLPNFVVINPCDYNQTKAATLAAAKHDGPVYLRFGRPKWPIFYPSDAQFEIGKAWKISDGADVSIFATGHLVLKAMEAAGILAEKGYTVDLINIHTIKPLDTQAVIESITKTRCAVTAEEHQVIGGLGSAIMKVVAEQHPVPVEFVGVRDVFGESGTPDQLLDKYGMSTQHVVDAALKAIARKG